MKAAIKTAEGIFKIKDVSRPEIADPNGVLARIKVAGICGTGRCTTRRSKAKSWATKWPPKWSRVGHAVTNVKAGDRVMVETLLGDGTCEWCRAKQYNLCPHSYDARMKIVPQAFAECLVGPSDKFYKLPDHVSDKQATLLDTFSVGLHAVHLSGLRLNDKAVVIGAGPIGLGQLQLAKLHGASVLVTDVARYPLQVARELGADEEVNPNDGDALERVMAFTGGRGADITFECAGGESMPTTLPQAVSYTRIGGKVVIVGDLLTAGKLNAKKLITQCFPLDPINRAFETAADKDKNQSIFVGVSM